MSNNNSVIPWYNTITVYDCNSSFVNTLRLTLCDYIRRSRTQTSSGKIEAQRIWQQWRNYIHTFKKWKISYNSDNRLSYRAFRLRLLLDYYFKTSLYHVSELWQHNKQTKKSDIISRRGLTQCLGLDLRKYVKFVHYLKTSNLVIKLTQSLSSTGKLTTQNNLRILELNK